MVRKKRSSGAGMSGPWWAIWVSALVFQLVIAAIELTQDISETTQIVFAVLHFLLVVVMIEGVRRAGMLAKDVGNAISTGRGDRAKGADPE